MRTAAAAVLLCLLLSAHTTTALLQPAQVTNHSNQQEVEVGADRSQPCCLNNTPSPVSPPSVTVAPNGQPLPVSCCSEWQIVQCSDIPINETAQLAQCCASNRPRPATAAALTRGQAAEAVAGDASVHGVRRWDVSIKPQSLLPNWVYGECLQKRLAEVPMFAHEPGDDSTQYTIVAQPVPLLTPQTIADIKAAALEAMPSVSSEAASAMRARAEAARAGHSSGFLHPAGYAGPAELAILRSRLASGSRLQLAAKESLLTGRGVPAKNTFSNWHPPVDTPLDYGGPLAMEWVGVDWGGWAVNRSSCPDNYPRDAPIEQCGHYAFVELDGAMSYKSAMAYVVTGDERYAQQAMDAVMAWAGKNKWFGINKRNGPLEAAWGCAAMARAVDLLRTTWPGFKLEYLTKFSRWANAVLVPQMDFYIDHVSPQGHNVPLLYGNWQASIADAMMALGVLTDDRARYNKGLALYRSTVEGYFRIGRAKRMKGRMLGECSETLRDVYHTLFGIGSLIQAAETGWGQNEDLYRESNYILAAALELHARIINARAANDESMLPAGFKFFESMPKPPADCAWRWDIETQVWTSYRTDRTKKKCSELKDGQKYLLGIKYLPNGFELGYNHFAGRLGMHMPETAALLARYPVDWYSFCWGLGTLTHADTAGELWRAGVRSDVLCEPRGPPEKKGHGHASRVRGKRPSSRS